MPAPGRELGVRSLGGGPLGCGSAPAVEAGTGDPEDGVRPLHAVTALVIGDELIAGQEPSTGPEFVARPTTGTDEATAPTSEDS
jgi:hypothetical protein